MKKEICFNHDPRKILKIQSEIPKVLNYFVTKQHNCKNVIINEKHGFTQGKFNTTNFPSHQYSILPGFDNRLQVDLIYTDFSKDSDRVNHSLR